MELVYAVVGIAWLVQYYQPCSDVTAKNLALGELDRKWGILSSKVDSYARMGIMSCTSSAGIVACNWLVILSVCITLMCTFDPTGRTFVKLKATRRRQRNLTTYTLRYRQILGWYPDANLNHSTQTKPAYLTCFAHKIALDSFIRLFSLSIRHRLEEGQASSWSRRLKFFMCCTRAQDTQSVSHTRHQLSLCAES